MNKTPKDNKTDPIEIGEVLAKRVFLSSPRETGRLLTWPPMSYSERNDRAERMAYKSDITCLSGIYIDDTDGEWYVFAEVDCFDPPLYAVRANGWEAAYDVFLDEFATVISEDNLKDYEEDDERLHYTDRGMVYTESIVGWEVHLVSVDC